MAPRWCRCHCHCHAQLICAAHTATIYAVRTGGGRRAGGGGQGCVTNPPYLAHIMIFFIQRQLNIITSSRTTTRMSTWLLLLPLRRQDKQRGWAAWQAIDWGSGEVGKWGGVLQTTTATTIVVAHMKTRVCQIQVSGGAQQRASASGAQKKPNVQARKIEDVFKGSTHTPQISVCSCVCVCILYKQQRYTLCSNWQYTKLSKAAPATTTKSVIYVCASVWVRVWVRYSYFFIPCTQCKCLKKGIIVLCMCLQQAAAGIFWSH